MLPRELRDGVPPNLLAAIGAMTIAAARTERVSRVLLWTLAGVPHTFGRQLTDSRGWGWVLEQIASLSRERAGLDGSTRPALADWKIDTDGARRKRNTYVHTVVLTLRASKYVADDQTWEEVGPYPVFAETGMSAQELMENTADAEEVWRLVETLESCESEGAALLDTLYNAIGFFPTETISVEPGSWGSGDNK